MEILKPEQEKFQDVDLLPEVKEIVDRYPYLKMVLEEICAHHDDTLVHLKKCGNLTFRLAEKLDYDEEKRSLLIQAALCHDIGKYESPLGVLDKLGEFDEGDWAQVKKHPEVGADYVRAEAPLVAGIVKRHHLHQENPYPLDMPDSGLGPEEKKTADELSRILAIIDKFETWTGKRSYKRPQKFVNFLPRLREKFSTNGDQEIINALIDLTGETKEKRNR